MLRLSDLPLPLDEKNPTAYLTALCAKKLGIAPKQIEHLTIVKRAVDARKKEQVQFRCTAEVTVAHEQSVQKRCKDKKVIVTAPYRYAIPKSKPLPTRPVVVGLGPAGLFCALLLAQAGQRPIVVERGSNVENRQKAVETFWQSGKLNPQCNVQFGEGGAGTFSDGKLNTGIKDKRCRKVLEELHKAGAPDAILTEAHPHIGTDYLPNTVANLRETIIALGGTVLFDTTVTDITLQAGKVTGVTLQKDSGTETLETNHVVFAIGHSARDTYEMLLQKGVMLTPKPFSVGVRVEHLQQTINLAQYGSFANHPALPSAEYHLSCHLANGRGVYSFCMCPGGTVVASASEEGGVVTNGMSNFLRDGTNANAALLVGITPEDFGTDHPLGGVFFQRDLEQQAFLLGGGDYKAPAQTVGDFLQNKKSHRLGEVLPTYQRGVTLTNLRPLFPQELGDSLAQGIVELDKKLHGFASSDALLTGVETRSSAPVRILRDDTFQSVTVKGLYPCGEGAGYAGGIVSAAVDGLKVAEAILTMSSDWQ